MNAVTGVFRSTKQEKIAWFVKQLPIIGIILLIAVGDSLANSVSQRWLPVLGFVLGASFACFSFYIVFPLISKIRTMEATKTEKIAWISGIPLAIIGGTVFTLNNSIAVIFNVRLLHTFVVSFIVGLGLVCVAYWIMTLSSELFKGDRIWKFCGIFLHSVLLIGVLIKYAFK
ncbi:MAG: hypothetical protein OXI43_23315 [Candidatus Poribacteria bacterium]|nr:hypothetical protein [Candidatus Poribacteria bacterium]